MAKRSSEHDFLFKTIIIGDCSVGKSSVMLRQCDDTFQTSYISTIGVDFRYSTITIDGKKVKLQIWDTAGQERFRTITAAYYRSSEIVIIVFDVTNRASYINVNRWITECKNNANLNIKLFLIGNKCDAQNRTVSKEEASAFARQENIIYMETSAKTGLGVNEAFETIAKMSINFDTDVPKTSKVNLRLKSEKKSFCSLL
jgi:small GTP-binding protein